jgi:hypothetical protein
MCTSIDLDLCESAPVPYSLGLLDFDPDGKTVVQFLKNHQMLRFHSMKPTHSEKKYPVQNC